MANMKSLVILSALLAVATSYAHVSTRTVASQIDPGNGLDRGDWGEVELCPNGTYGYMMDIKYEPRQNVDDTCTNAFKLYCYDSSGIFWGDITSTEGQSGEWIGPKACPQGKFINGYSMKVEGLVGNFDDDLGVVDIRAECEDGTILTGATREATENKVSKPKPMHTITDKTGDQRGVVRPLIHKLTPEEIEIFSKRGLVKKPQPREDGTWGPIATCPDGTKVCGLQSQVEEQHAVDDDAGLCNLLLFCCY